MMNNVRVIPATILTGAAHQVFHAGKRPVCGYARVSTDSDEQETSYEAQVDYYTKYIKGRPDWEFKGVYTDDGVTGTSTKKRDGFNRMVQDALDGKISLIVTKSVSRFARNTVDSLTTVRLLKEHGAEVFFQKENIHTFDGKGELLITIMSSIAQEESRSISENVTWAHRKRFADGKLIMPYGQFLGYEKGEDGKPRIVESEAAIVRLIFRLFMEGKTPSAIAKWLEKQEIPSPAGKKTWQAATVRSILENEKYKGDALLQKSFTVDFLTKKTKHNEGEVPQYYVEGSHPAIIAPEEFDAVQAEIARRRKLGRPCTCNSPFSAKIVCGECGAFYGSKVWGSNTKYRRVIWRCNDKYKGNAKCDTPHVTEEEIRQGFLSAYNTLMGTRKELIENCRLAQSAVCDCSAIDAEIEELRREIDIVSELTRKAIEENARAAVDQAEWNERYNSYLERHRKATGRMTELEHARQERKNKSLTIDTFIRNLRKQPLVLEEFDERLWGTTIERVTVATDGKLAYTFKDGTEIQP